MPDLLEQGARFLDAQRTAHLSRVVTYRRGTQSIEVHATIGRTVFRLDDAGGAVIRFVSRDYLIRAADLRFDGAPERTTPQRGDQIVETDDDGTTYTHEVLAPASPSDTY